MPHDTPHKPTLPLRFQFDLIPLPDIDATIIHAERKQFESVVRFLCGSFIAHKDPKILVWHRGSGLEH